MALLGQMIRSDISAVGLNLANPGSTDPQPREASTDGYEAWLQADFNRAAPTTHTLKAPAHR